MADELDIRRGVRNHVAFTYGVHLSKKANGEIITNRNGLNLCTAHFHRRLSVNPLKGKSGDAGLAGSDREVLNYWPSRRPAGHHAIQRLMESTSFQIAWTWWRSELSPVPPTVWR